MKKLLTVCLASLLLFTACGEASPQASGETAKPTPTAEATAITTDAPTSAPTETPEPTPRPVLGSWDGKKIKILAVGNSYSMNAMQYFFEICKAEGAEEVILGNLVISGCWVDKHIDLAISGEKAYSYRKCKMKSPTAKFSNWKQTEEFSLRDAVADEEWDVITFQQASDLSGVPSSYDKVPVLVSTVKAMCPNKECTFAWHQTWAHQPGCTVSTAISDRYGNDQKQMYSAIVESVREKILPLENISVLLSSGTAVQNARATAIGDNLNTDGSHLNEMGQYIAGYTWYAALTGKTLDELKFTGVKMTDEERELIRQSVNAAITDPLPETK